MSEELTGFLRRVATRTDATLDAALPAVSLPPQRLHEAMRYCVFAGGKRLRPAFVIATSELGDPNLDLANRAAAALELVHTYSLVHDDLPSMDDDDLRRGQPTCHVAFDEATAILVGDALLTLAFEVLAGSSASAPAARAVLRLAHAAGCAGMVGGQIADLAAEDDPAATSTELLFIHRHKTGALFGAATALGALAAGLSDGDVDTLEQFGQQVGIAFQITDDLLDVEGDTCAIGKTAGKDESAGKLTFPRLFGVVRSRALAQEAVEQALAILDPFQPGANGLGKLVRVVIDRRA